MTYTTTVMTEQTHRDALYPFVAFSKIGSFKDARHNILKHMGGELSPHLPVVIYTGTVKIHGTNAAVVVWKDDTVTVQSRKRTLSCESDNAGFHSFAMDKVGASHWLAAVHNVIDDFDAVVLYGEWCGRGIQTGMSINGEERFFVIFSVQGLTRGQDSEGVDYFTSTHLPLGQFTLESSGIHEIINFGTYTLPVDFRDATSAVECMNTLTLGVEDNCPVGARLNPKGESNLGEGIVWVGQYEHNDYTHTSIFKSKGEKHEKTGKSRTIKAPTVYTEEQLAAVSALTEVGLKEERLFQGLDYLKEMEMAVSLQNTGKYIGWVMKDISDECTLEIEELAELDITWKQLTPSLIKSIVVFFKEQV